MNIPCTPSRLQGVGFCEGPVVHAKFIHDPFMIKSNIYRLCVENSNGLYDPFILQTTHLPFEMMESGSYVNIVLLYWELIVNSDY